MNWDQVEGKWKQLRGRIKERWGKLRDNDLDVIQGRRKQLVGKVQELYGIVREKAEEQVSAFEERLFSPRPGQVVKVRIRLVRRRTPVKTGSRSKARRSTR